MHIFCVCNVDAQCVVGGCAGHCIYIHAYIYIHTHIYIHTCIHTHTHNICVCVCVCARQENQSNKSIEQNNFRLWDPRQLPSFNLLSFVFLPSFVPLPSFFLPLFLPRFPPFLFSFLDISQLFIHTCQSYHPQIPRHHFPFPHRHW